MPTNEKWTAVREAGECPEWCVMDGDFYLASIYPITGRDTETTARQMAASHDLLGACKRAYISLLRLDTSHRLARQQELCLLREVIAQATGTDERDVQDGHEAVAALLNHEATPA